MRKNIAVLVPDFMVEHCRDFIEGVLKYFREKDYAIYIANTQRNFYSPGMFEYQYWNSLELLKSKQIDAYIIATGVFTSALPYDDVRNMVISLGDRPIVSDSVELNLPNSYSVLADCKQSYKDIVSHLKLEHGCKKIAFMAANSTDSQEALERFEAFKAALEENSLKFYEELVFEGEFTDFKAKKIIKDRYKDKSQIDFDALVAANDLMATGCITAFEEIGVKVPADVKVVGFDDAVFASLSSPRLSTVNQNIVNKGSRCAEVAEMILTGQEVEHVIKTPLFPIFRQSCGCIPLTSYEMVYKNYRGNIFNESNMKSDLLRLYQNEVLERYKYGSLLDIVNVTNTLRQFYFTMNLVTRVMEITAMSVCLFEEPVYINKRTGYVLPDKAELYMYYNSWTGKECFRPNIFFNPKEEICPTYKVEEFGLPLIVYPIFSGEVYYGYLVCNVERTNFNVYTFNLKILISFIANSIEYTRNLIQTEKLSTENSKLLENNSDLYMKSKTDELTGILNRRGFMEIGQRTIDLIQEIDSPAIVFFADMDGLKVINDTYGHDMGDKAIVLQSKVLKNVFRKNDIIGRLGGDEFAMIGNGMSINDVPSIRKKLEEECKKVSKEENLPFTLSLSVGAVDLEASSMLARLLTEADKLLYKEKRIKHGEQ